MCGPTNAIGLTTSLVPAPLFSAEPYFAYTAFTCFVEFTYWQLHVWSKSDRIHNRLAESLDSDSESQLPK